MTQPVVTQADAEVAEGIVSGVRGYGVTFGEPLRHSASLSVARHRASAVEELAEALGEVEGKFRALSMIFFGLGDDCTHAEMEIEADKIKALLASHKGEQ